MKKTYKLEELDCANCAAKIEAGVARLRGVKSVSVSFMAQKMTLEADDAVFADVLCQAVKTAKRIEPGCKVLL